MCNETMRLGIKTVSGRLTAHQKAFHAGLREAGFGLPEFRSAEFMIQPQGMERILCLQDRQP